MPHATLVHLAVVPEKEGKWWAATVAITFAHGEAVSDCERVARRVAMEFVDSRGSSFVRAEKEGVDRDTHIFYDVWGPPREDALKKLAEGRWEKRSI